MTTRTPETMPTPPREPNTPGLTCATPGCGHKARTHADHGYGPCTAKACAELADGCAWFVFAAEAANADPEASPVAATPAPYTPAAPFDPAKHLRILTHRNNRTGEVTESAYLDVKWRAAWLRSGSGVAAGYLPAHPEWRITVDQLLDWSEVLERGVAVFRARLWDGDAIIAEGHGSQAREEWHDFIEKAETKAIGRCLIAAGYGTAAAAELEEGDNISEGGVERSVRGAPGRLPAGERPACPHGHPASDMHLITSRFRPHEGQPVYWCSALVDGEKKCSWTLPQAEWEAEQAPAAVPFEAPAPVDPAPGERPASPVTSAARAFDAAAIPGLLTQYRVTMPDVMRRWDLHAATPQEFLRVMAEEHLTLADVIAGSARDWPTE
jgi:hypothetical protein